MPNTSPTLTGFAASLNVISTSGPTLLDADVVFSDADDNFVGGRVQITGLLSGDVAAVRHQGSGAGQIGFNAGTGEVSYGGVVIGVVTTGPARSFNIAFNASTTNVAVDALIQNLTFDTDQDTPTGSRTLRLGVFDHAGAVVNGPSTPSFTGLLFDLSVASHADPGFVDLDADGWVDAVIGDGNGFITVLDGAGGAFSSTGLDNPFIGIDFGTRASPTFGDLDNDGDVDAVIGSGDGLLRTFENQGGGVFSELTGGLNPFSGIDVGTISSPELADIDGDGDKDLIIGAGDGTLKLYWRTGSSYVLAGGESPFLGFDVGADTSPSFGDIDGDGDADMVLGSDDGTIRTYANTGSGFSLLGGAANPFNGYDNGFYSKTSLADLDGDGDLDLVIGDSYGNLDRYRNNEPRPSITVNVTFNDSPALSGLRSSAVFTENQVAATPQLLDTQVRLTDADGAFNGGSLSVSGLVSGDIVSVRHQGSGAGQIGFSSGTVSYGGAAIGTASGGTGGTALTISFNSSASTAAVDALIQNLTYANLSDAPIADRTLTITATDAYGGANAASPPRFVQADSNPFQIGFTGPTSRASFGDVDLDGDLDVAIGQADGTIVYFRNTGGPTDPVYDWPFGFNPFYGLDFGDNSAPALADLDGDGDVDGLVTNSNGTVRYFRNDGAQQWVERTGANNPFNGVNVGYFVAPTIADVDGDGRKDVVVGNFDGDLRYFRNTGSVSSPAFTEQSGASSPFDGIDIGAGSAPAFGDLDADGDLDLFVGKGDGEIAYYRNTGSTTQPVYVLQSGAANPFDGVNVGSYAAPSLADLDSDGDVDAFVGPGGYGSFYFINTAQQDSIAVHVTAVNDAPTLSGVATTVTFSENDVAGAGQVLDADVTFADPDSDGGVLRVGGLLGEDRVSVRNQGTGAGQIGFNSGTGQVTFGGNLIGLASGGVGASLVVTLNAAATPAAMDALIQNLTYANVSGAPTASRTLTISVSDAGGAPANGPYTPSFTNQTGGANPFAAIDVSRSDPAFTDFDGDGRQDLVLGQLTGNLLAYRNTGSGFTQVTGGSNPFDGIVIDAPYGSSYGSPTFADIDGDGDQDLVLGYADGGLRAFEKTGSGYVELTGGANPFAAIATGYMSRPSFGDFDGDGDLDLILNGYSFVTLAYRNTGSGYVQITNPFQSAYTSIFSFAFADIDGDGDMDAVAASTYGDELLTFRNDAGTFVQLSGGANPFGGVAVYDGTVTFGDVDGDGDLDLVSGDVGGTLTYFRNNQPPAASITVEVIATNSPPTGTDAPVTLLEDGAHVFTAANFGYGDSEGDAFLAVKITTLPGAGALKLNGADVTAGQVVSIADVNSGLLVFTPAANANGAAYASFTFQVQDDGGTALGGVDLDPSPNTITLNVTPVNDAPSGANTTVALLEDGSHTFATSEFGFSDPIDGHSLLAVVISTLPPAGSLKLNGVAVTAGQAVSAANIAAGLLVYSPAANGNGMAYGTFTFQVRDNGGTANGGLDTDGVPNFMHVNVTAVNDAPTLTDLGPSVTFNENTVNAAPQLLDTAVEFTDLEDNFDGGTLTLTGLLAQDVVSIRNEGSGAGQIGFAGGTVTYGGVTIGTASGGSGATLTITFSASATSAAIDALIQNLTYANISEAPTASRTLRIEVTDAAGASTFSASPAFTERTGGANPFNGVDVGYKSVPAFADLDGDGDLDAIVGANNLTRYYLNTGSATSPTFVEQTGGANPFAALNATTPGPRQRPTLADLDGDGDLDLLVGVLSGAFAYYQNTGTASAPAFTLQTGAANPMNGVSIPFRPTPSFVDLDADGDIDLMIGDGGGVTRYYRNDGSPSAPNFVLASSPLGGDVGFESVPRFADIDRDGDLDAFVSAHDGSIHFYRNTGTATSPVFAEETGAANPFNGLGFGSYAAVSLADLDGDGLFDAVVGTDAGTLRFFENTTGVPIVVNVTAQNDAPGGADATITIDEGATRVMAAADFGFSDVDGNSLAAVKVTSLPTAGALKLNNVDVTTGQSVSAADIAAGLLVFAPAANANGTGYASLAFQVQDNGGTANGGVDLDPSANTLTFNVTAVNDAPSGADKTVSVAEDSGYVFAAADFGFSDAIEGHALAAVKISSLPAAGSLKLNGAAVSLNQFVSVADINAGLLVFSPAANANGNGYASFGFQVQDNGGTANGGVDLDGSANTITVNVTPANDPPAGTDKTVNATEDGQFVFATGDFGFTDPLDSGDTLVKVKVTTLPSTGFLLLDGTAVTIGQEISAADITGGLLTYFAGANANGAALASFTFQVSDGVAFDPSPNTITIDVAAVNDAPQGANKTVTVLEDGAFTFAVADFGFSDPVEGHTLSEVKITTLPAAGSLKLNGVAVTAGQSVNAADIAAGLLVFSPAANANGAAYASFTFQVQDNGGTTNGGVNLDPTPNTITLNVTAVNDRPELTGLAASVTFAENTVNAGPQLLDTSVVLTDPESNFNGGTLEVFGLLAEDTVTLLHQGGGAGEVGYDAGSGEVRFGDVLIGTASGGAGDDFNVTFNAAATTTAVDAVIQRLAYGNGAGDPTASRTLNIRVTDADGAVNLWTTAPPQFVEQTGAANPFNGAGFDPRVVPTLADLDGDGDFDLILNSGYAGTIRFFENTGGPSAPAFVQRTGAANPFNGVSLGSMTQLDVGDFDNDGDLDAVAARCSTGELFLLENVAGTYVLRTGGANPFDGLNGGGTTSPTVGDVDGDGDLDLVTGQYDEFLHYFENTGGATTPTFVERTGGANPFTGLALQSHNEPELYDLDFDGDLDLVTGGFIGPMRYFLNTGSATAPVYVQQSGVDSPFPALSKRYQQSPAFADLDGDGRPDVLAGALIEEGAFNLQWRMTYLTNPAPEGGADIRVNVNAQNDAPSGADKTVTTLEDNAYVFTLADFGYSDSDGDSLEWVKITSLPSSGSLLYYGVPMAPGEEAYAPFIAAGNLSYSFASDANGAAYASFTFQVRDNGGTANGGLDLDQSANTITVNITPVNDAPSGTDATVTINEDVVHTFAAADFGFSDALDGNALQAVRIATVPAAGSLRLSGVNVNAGDIITAADLAAGKLKFTPAANANGNGYANFTFQVRDNGGTLNGGANLDPTANTLTFNVTAVNDAPTLTGWGPSKTVAENASPQVLDGNVVFGDVEANLDGGTLTVSSLLAEDIVAVRNQGTAAGQIGFNAGTGAVTYGGTLIGTATGGDGDDFVVTFNASATVAAVDALIENLTYENESDAPTLSRTLRLAVVDAALGAVSNLAMTVNITPANDAPVITAPGAYAADVGVKTALTGISFADADAGAADVTATLQVASGTLAANASGGVDVTGTGTGTLTLVGTIAQLNAFIAAEKVSFTSDGTATDPVLTLTIDDGGASGGSALTDQALITISVADHRKGTAGKDVLIGQAEDSHLEGLGGNDTLSGGDGNDSLQGGNGADVLNGGTGNDTLEGGANDDTASYEGAAAGVTVSLGIAGLQNTIGAGQDSLLEIEALLGSAFADQLTGDGLGNTLTGALGADTLAGGDGDDRLVGGDGSDLLQGGAGLDVLYGNADADVMSGGADNDRFVFLAQSDSRKSDPDRITDLAAGDLIDVRAVDANANKDGDQAFQLVGSFTNKAGQAMLSYNGTLDQTSLLLDLNGDSKSDMTIVLDGNHMGFTGFVL